MSAPNEPPQLAELARFFVSKRNLFDVDFETKESHISEEGVFLGEPTQRYKFEDERTYRDTSTLYLKKFNTHIQQAGGVFLGKETQYSHTPGRICNPG